jgi:hypothetical protein
MFGEGGIGCFIRYFLQSAVLRAIPPFNIKTNKLFYRAKLMRLGDWAKYGILGVRILRR